jgi:uncharacterized protein YjbJ (UPF0337 family)
MAWGQIKDDLNDFIINVKEQWIWFIDDQIDVIEGKRNHFCGKTQKAYVIDSEEAEKRLADWQNLQRDKIRNQGGQLRNCASSTPSHDGFSYSMDSASRNWQLRSDR